MGLDDPAARDPASGADFLQLSPAAAPARGLTSWLAGALRASIRDGRLAPGTSLPATRVLAGELGVSRGVIVEAYQRLRDEGLVSAQPGAGTRVLSPGSGQQFQRRATPPAAGRAARWRWTPAGGPDPARLPPSGPDRQGIDLSPGVPDLSAFPRAAWLHAERAVLRQASAGTLGYGDPRGHELLRQELAGWLALTRGLRTGPEGIIIVAGVAQSLALLAHVLRERGTTGVGVEDPGSRGARDELAYWGLRPAPVPVDDHGLRVDELARSGVRAALLTPAHQFPTGVVLAPHRRRDLLAWAADDGLIVEDDYDAEYRYDRAPVPALQASAPERVAYTGSASKTLAPGLRLGWLVPPSHLHADLIAAKHASDLGSPALPQLILAHLIGTGELARHIRVVRQRQRKRRDALLAALREHVPRARVRGVAAGLHLLLMLPELPGHADDAALADCLQLAGVLVHPLSWHRQRPGPPGLVLGYAARTPDQLREAAERIGQAVRAARHQP